MPFRSNLRGVRAGSARVKSARHAGPDVARDWQPARVDLGAAAFCRRFAFVGVRAGEHPLSDAGQPPPLLVCEPVEEVLADAGQVGQRRLPRPSPRALGSKERSAQIG